MEDRYDAFISYSHRFDGTLAPMLQQEVERFATPWYRQRALRVFRDNANLTANNALWPSIEAALASSSWFVLMASQTSAESEWVGKEVAWWLEHRSIETLLVVVTDGHLRWDGRTGSLDADASTAVHPRLHSAFVHEPRWVDLTWLRDADQVDRSNPQWRNAVADVASALRDMPKDLLVGEHIRLHRRAVRLARTGVATLVVFLVLALVAGFVAFAQRDEAQRQTRVATARLLAARAVADLDTRLDRAQLLAVEAYRMDPSPESRAALFQAVTANPALRRFLPVGAPVTKIVASSDGKVAVAGTTTGHLVHWPVTGGEHHDVDLRIGSIIDLAVSHDGRTTVATDGSTTVLWHVGDVSAKRLAGSSRAVAASADGATVARLENPEGQPSAVVLHDGNTGVETRRVQSEKSWSKIGFPSEEAMVLVSPLGKWERRDFDSLSLLDESDLMVTPFNGFVPAYSDNATLFAFFKFSVVSQFSNSPPLDLTSLQDGTSQGLSAPAIPVQEATVLAISEDGTRAAVAGGGLLYVADTATTRIAEAPLRLAGTGEIEAVALVGQHRVVSASEGVLALWDTTAPGRVSTDEWVEVPDVSNASPRLNMAVQPEDDRVVITGILPDDTRKDIVPDWTKSNTSIVFDRQAGNLVPVWTSDHRRLALVREGGAATVYEESVPVAEWAATGKSTIIAGQSTPEGDRVVLLDVHGGVQVRDSDTGVVISAYAGEAPGAHPLKQPRGALNHDASLAVVTTGDDRVATVVEVSTGKWTRIPGEPASDVAYAGDSLLVQRVSGPLEVWDSRGTTRIKVIGGDAGFSGTAHTYIRGSDLVTRLRGDGTVTVVDLPSSTVLGSIELPRRKRGALAASPWAATAIIDSPRGNELITATPAGKAIRWRMSTENWLSIACVTAARDLTPEEWRQTTPSDPPSSLSCPR